MCIRDRILSGELEDMVEIYLSANHILFEFDDTKVVSRLIEGEYFKIDQMLSSDYETKVKINKKEFLDCIDRATLLVKEGDKKPIIIHIQDGQMELRIDSQTVSYTHLDVYKRQILMFTCSLTSSGNSGLFLSKGATIL